MKVKSSRDEESLRLRILPSPVALSMLMPTTTANEDTTNHDSIDLSHITTERYPYPHTL